MSRRKEIKRKEGEMVREDGEKNERRGRTEGREEGK